MDECRRTGTTDVRDVRISADLTRPIAVFVDNLDGLTQDSSPQIAGAAEGVKTLIGFLAKTGNQSNVSLIVGSEIEEPAESAGLESLWNSAARLQLAASTDPDSDEQTLYFAAPGLPGVALETADVR
jgi:hypothetical protein